MFIFFIAFFLSKTIKIGLAKFVKNAEIVVSELVAGSGEQEDTRNKKLKTFFW